MQGDQHDRNTDLCDWTCIKRISRKNQSLGKDFHRAMRVSDGKAIDAVAPPGKAARQPAGRGTAPFPGTRIRQAPSLLRYIAEAEMRSSPPGRRANVLEQPRFLARHSEDGNPHRAPSFWKETFNAAEVNSPGNASQKIADQGKSIILFWLLAAFVISAVLLYAFVKLEVPLTGDSFVLSHKRPGEEKQGEFLCKYQLSEGLMRWPRNF